MRLPYTYRFDDVDSTTTYIGKAAAGALDSAPVWRIAKWVKSGALTSIKYADGATSFNSIWDNRASLTYI